MCTNSECYDHLDPATGRFAFCKCQQLLSSLPESRGGVQCPATERLQCVPQLQLQSPALLSLQLPGGALLGKGSSAAKCPCKGQQLAAPVGKVGLLHVLPEEGNEPGPGLPFSFQCLHEWA